MPNLNSYGFIGYEDIAGERVVDGNIRIINDAIAASLAEHNRQVNEALKELTDPTTEHTARFKLPGGGTLQPADEWSNPLPVQVAGYYDVAFPIQGGQTAWGDNRVSRALMTVAEADRNTMTMLRQDADWMKRHILAALLDNGTWTFTDPEKGALTVQPLANGDAVTYLKKNGASATDTHYYAQAGAIADAANPFPTWKTELSEHAGNDGPYVAYVPTNLRSSIENLANFIEVANPDVDPGIMAPRLRSAGVSRGFGDEVFGYVDGVYVVEMAMLPDNYGIVVARGASTKVLWMRQYPAAALQNFFQENHSPDGNLNEYRFFRYAGFGAYNRVGALAFRIGNGAYATPTGYSTPLAV